MDTEALRARAEALDEAGNRENVTLNDARIIAFLLDSCEITVPEDAVFFVNVNCDGILSRIVSGRVSAYAKTRWGGARQAGAETRAFTGAPDFGHTAPL